MTKRSWIICGYRPVDRDVNAFLAVLDLGIDGTYVLVCERITCSLLPNNLADRLPELLKHHLEADLGYVGVCITELMVTNDEKVAPE